MLLFIFKDKMNIYILLLFLKLFALIEHASTNVKSCALFLKLHGQYMRCARKKVIGQFIDIF